MGGRHSEPTPRRRQTPDWPELAADVPAVATVAPGYTMLYWITEGIVAEICPASCLSGHCYHYLLTK